MEMKLHKLGCFEFWFSLRIIGIHNGKGKPKANTVIFTLL